MRTFLFRSLVLLGANFVLQAGVPAALDSAHLGVKSGVAHAHTKIRLQRHGKKGKPFYHIVVATTTNTPDAGVMVVKAELSAGGPTVKVTETKPTRTSRVAAWTGLDFYAPQTDKSATLSSGADATGRAGGFVIGVKTALAGKPAFGTSGVILPLRDGDFRESSLMDDSGKVAVEIGSIRASRQGDDLVLSVLIDHSQDDKGDNAGITITDAATRKVVASGTAAVTNYAHTWLDVESKEWSFSGDLPVKFSATWSAPDGTEWAKFSDLVQLADAHEESTLTDLDTSLVIDPKTKSSSMAVNGIISNPARLAMTIKAKVKGGKVDPLAKTLS